MPQSHNSLSNHQNSFQLGLNCLLSNKFSFQFTSQIMEDIFPILSYSGSLFSAVIAFKLFKMEHLNFINLMFLVYFAMDSLIGPIETFLLVKLVKERYLEDLKQIIFKSNPFQISVLEDQEIQKKNCDNYFILWYFRLENCSKFLCGLMLCRQVFL